MIMPTKEQWARMTPEQHDRIREYNRAWEKAHPESMRERCSRLKASRTRFLNVIKTFTGCDSCGYNDSACALDFHHLGTKQFTIGSRRTRSIGSLATEIMKCAVLCATCHRRVTKGEIVL